MKTITRTGWVLACMLLAAGLPVAAQAQDKLPTAGNDSRLADRTYDPGHGSVFFGLQAIEVESFDIGNAEVDIGSVSTQSLYLEIEHALSERWLVRAGLPWIRKDYDGPGRHDPLKLVPPRPHVPFIDDGNYHSSFQDLSLGVQYLLDTEPLIIQPFVVAYLPTQDYPHFGQAAVGQNVWKLELGLEATHILPFSDWYYRLAGSYTVVEETLDVNVNHFRAHGELGYFLNPELSINLFFHAKDGRGDDATDFPIRTDERWYQHDRTSRHSFVNVGLGMDWLFHERWQLTASGLTSVWGSTVHLVDWSASLGLTRYY